MNENDDFVSDDETDTDLLGTCASGKFDEILRDSDSFSVFTVLSDVTELKIGSTVSVDGILNVLLPLENVFFDPLKSDNVKLVLESDLVIALTDGAGAGIENCCFDDIVNVLLVSLLSFLAKSVKFSDCTLDENPVNACTSPDVTDDILKVIGFGESSGACCLFSVFEDLKT